MNWEANLIERQAETEIDQERQRETEIDRKTRRETQTGRERETGRLVSERDNDVAQTEEKSADWLQSYQKFSPSSWLTGKSRREINDDIIALSVFLFSSLVGLFISVIRIISRLHCFILLTLIAISAIDSLIKAVKQMGSDICFRGLVEGCFVSVWWGSVVWIDLIWIELNWIEIRFSFQVKHKESES